MPRYEITKFFSNSGSRNEVRMRVVDALAAETPGTGNEDASKYIYVETLNSETVFICSDQQIFTTDLRMR